MFRNIATIDGPPASGKTTMASLIAKEFGLTHLDSGAIFRAITLDCMKKGVDLSNPTDVIKQLNVTKPRLSGESVFLNGENVTDEIRDPQVSNSVCFISHLPEVRKFVKEFQLSYSKTGKVVCDGRKVGTEVFPNAKVKFYLTARQDVRALRRYLQLWEKNKSICFADVFRDLKQREAHEIENGILLIPKNAIVIDNSDLSIEETLMQMEEYIK